MRIWWDWNYNNNNKKLQEPFHSPVPPQVLIKAHNRADVNPLYSRCTRWFSQTRRWMSCVWTLSTSPCQCPHQCYRSLPRSLSISTSRWWLQIRTPTPILSSMVTTSPPLWSSTRCRCRPRSTPAPSMLTLLTSSCSFHPTHYRCRTILWKWEASHSPPTCQRMSMSKCTRKVLTSSPVARTKPTSIWSSQRSKWFRATNREKRMPRSCWTSDGMLIDHI